MINDQPYLDLEKYINLDIYDSLHLEICRGIATAYDLAYDGLQTVEPNTLNPLTRNPDIKYLHEAYEECNSLPDDDPTKVFSKDLTYNQLSTYLKFALGAYDSYLVYRILEPDDTEMIKHFPNLIKFVLQLKEDGIFDSLHSANLFAMGPGGMPYEHKDPGDRYDLSKNKLIEFIHIKTDGDRPFYVLNPQTNERAYIDTRVSWFDERDYHGGEPINRASYNLRINGEFSMKFKKQIGFIK